MSTNAHHEKKRLTNPPATIKFKIQRGERKVRPNPWETLSCYIAESKCHLRIDGDPQESVTSKVKQHATRMGHELSRTGLRHLHYGDRRHSTTICSALIDDLLLASGGNTVILSRCQNSANVRDLKVTARKCSIISNRSMPGST
jgi:hypothetical protein